MLRILSDLRNSFNILGLLNSVDGVFSCSMFVLGIGGVRKIREENKERMMSVGKKREMRGCINRDYGEGCDHCETESISWVSRIQRVSRETVSFKNLVYLI